MSLLLLLDSHPRITIPTEADIRAALFSIIRNDLGAQEFALQSGFDFGGTRFREWQPFAPLIDLGVLIDVNPVMEITPGASCRSKFYESRFTLHVQHGAAGSTLASEWLGVLESALDDSSTTIVGPNSEVEIRVKDVEFISRGAQMRLEESWNLPSLFKCKVGYA